MHNYWLLLFGVISFLVAIYLLWKEVTLRISGVRTTGVVVDVVRRRERNNGVTFQPLVQFITRDGQQIVWKSTTSSSFWRNIQGKQWKIIYDPRNPLRVIRNHWSGYACIVLLCFVGTFCIVVFFVGLGG